MPTADQIRRMQAQRLTTYGFVPPVGPTPPLRLLASGVTGPMVGGQITIFPLGLLGVVPADVAIQTQRFAPGGGALGETWTDNISPGVGGSFQIISDAATEVSTWRWFIYTAQGL